MKPLSWIGSSKEDLLNFPASIRREAGFQLDKVQHGENPDDWKPMPTIGTGVKEIRLRDTNGAFRIIYIAQIGDAVHVLHCFQKKTAKTGITDLRLAQQRLKTLMRELP
ncbi:MAG TPA: type II toxin-antitoxin system RelE/ParE family toxin [Rudaea sp.]|jgi:phage-related protein|nr:type II toxin-antitoxin system RelE/ParE family toxin [Rudaea sp.]